MSERKHVFIGTYTERILFGTGQILEGKGQGIYRSWLDAETGALGPCKLAATTINPSYLAFHPSQPYLYAVNELKEFEGAKSGAVSAFALDPATGQLAFLNSKPTHGTDPCHLVVDPTGRYVLVANFASGSVCVLPVQADGSLGDATDFAQHRGSSVDPVRQAGPHAHGVTLDRTGRFAFVPDLGLDRVMIYRLDMERGRLVPNSTPWVEVTPGAGPRQLVMHPGGEFAYLINELNSTMTAFRYDAGEGALRAVQTLSTLPDGWTGKSTCAEVQVSPSGGWLFGSNRGHDSIVVYAIDAGSGMLTYAGHQNTLGKIPRSFTVAPRGSYLIVANQDSANVVSLRHDPDTGRLLPTGQTVTVPTPVCVKVLGGFEG